MIPEHKFIRLILGNDFYEKHKSKIVKEMFPGDLGHLYDSIKEGHTKYSRDLKISDVRILLKTRYPAMTQATRNNIEEIFVSIDEDKDPISQDIADEVLHHMFKQEAARRIADYGIKLMDGIESSLLPLQNYIASIDSDFTPIEEFEPIPTDLDDVLGALESRSCWEFNIPSFAKHVRGGAEGEFIVVMARPDIGKTSLLASITAGPGGFVDQGAQVAWFCNEEPGIRVKMRCIEACTGYNRDDITADPAKRVLAKNEWSKVKDHIFMVDNVDLTIAQLDSWVKRHSPNIVITDQLDKVSVFGSYDSNHDKLRQLYIEARAIAKRHNCLMIGVCQASAEAEGKTQVTYNMAENSKTGKGAEADLFLGIGKRPVTDGSMQNEDYARYLHTSKNKLTGWKGTVPVKFQPEISRYIE